MQLPVATNQTLPIVGASHLSAPSARRSQPQALLRYIVMHNPIVRCDLLTCFDEFDDKVAVKRRKTEKYVGREQVLANGPCPPRSASQMLQIVDMLLPVPAHYCRRRDPSTAPNPTSTLVWLLFNPLRINPGRERRQSFSFC
jgi:hypothetical protein